MNRSLLVLLASLRLNHMGIGMTFAGSTGLSSSLTTGKRASLPNNSMDQLEVLPSVSRVRAGKQPVLLRLNS
jgi:hypothetical protein